MTTVELDYVYVDEESIADNLKCEYICKNPLVQPVEHTCGNLFCKHCFELQEDCPVCDLPASEGVQEVKMKNFLKLLDRLMVVCAYCGEEVQRGELREHMDACLIACDCGKQIPKLKLEQHKKECLHEIVECKASDVGCHWEDQRRELLAHQGSCPYYQLRSTLQEYIQREKEAFSKELLSTVFTLKPVLIRCSLQNLSSRYITDFSNRDYTGSNFCGAHLGGADFSHSDLENVNFNGCDLSGADFSYCSLKGAKFIGAQLFSVQFDHANLRRVNFDKVKVGSLHSCKFGRSFIPPGTLSNNVEGSILSGKSRCTNCHQVNPKDKLCSWLIMQCNECDDKLVAGCVQCNLCTSCKCHCRNPPNHDIERFIKI